MSFTVTFYTTEADPIEVDKALTLVKTVEGVLYKETTDRKTPQLILAYDVNIEGANYCLVNGYYYFIEDYQYGQQRLILQLKRDILMSFKDDIYDMYAIVKRQENEFFTYINDDKLPIDCRRLVTGFKFPYGFSDTDELLLLVNGKGGGGNNE